MGGPTVDIDIDPVGVIKNGEHLGTQPAKDPGCYEGSSTGSAIYNDAHTVKAPGKQPCQIVEVPLRGILNRVHPAHLPTRWTGEPVLLGKQGFNLFFNCIGSLNPVPEKNLMPLSSTGFWEAEITTPASAAAPGKVGNAGVGIILPGRRQPTDIPAVRAAELPEQVSRPTTPRLLFPLVEGCGGPAGRPVQCQLPVGYSPYTIGAKICSCLNTLFNTNKYAEKEKYPPTVGLDKHKGDTLPSSQVQEMELVLPRKTPASVLTVIEEPGIG